MLEEDAELFRDFRTQAMLNLAGIFIQQIFVDLEHLIEKPLGKPVAADDVTGVEPALRGE